MSTPTTYWMPRDLVVQVVAEVLRPSDVLHLRFGLSAHYLEERIVQRANPEQPTRTMNNSAKRTASEFCPLFAM